MYVSKVRDRLLEVLRQHDTQFTEAFLAHLVQAQENAEKAERWPQVIEYARSFAEELDRLGHWKTLSILLSRASAAAESSGRRDEKAWALNARGNVAWPQGDYAAAHTYYQDSLAIRKKLGDHSGIATCLNNLGSLAHWQGDYAAARKYYQDSLAIRKELGDRSGIASTLNNLGAVAEYEGSGDLGAAEKYFGEARQLAASLSASNDTLGKALWGLGRVAAKRRKKGDARQYVDQTIQIFQLLGHSELQAAQQFRDSLGSAPDPVQCRKTCDDLQAKGELAASVVECVKKLCAD